MDENLPTHHSATPTLVPTDFYAEPIDVQFIQPPLLRKRPHCPDSFTWREKNFMIVKVIEEWVDYSRRGRTRHNMRPRNLSKAIRRGSWGVGRFYFRVQTAGNRYFDLYYDRAPKDAGDRMGHWYIWRELMPIRRG